MDTACEMFLDVMTDLFNLVDKKNGRACPMISEKCMKVIEKHSERLNSAIVYDRDFNYNYFGFKVCE
jgi:ribonucleoside-diphosphate reductase subunit M1